MKLLTTNQIAEQCGVGVDKVIFWITSKQLIAINVTEKVGKQARWRVKPSEFEAFLQRRTTQPRVPRRQRVRARPARVVEI